MKLWSYGDSHTAGHELGVLPNLGSDYLQLHYGVSTREQFIDRYGEDRYRNQLQRELDDVYTAPNRVQLTYAGQLAEIMNVTHVSRAKNGTGNDHSAQCLMKDLPNITNNDLIVFGLSGLHRFWGEHNVKDKLSNHEYIVEHGPVESTWRVWFQGIAALVAKIAPCQVIFVNTAAESQWSVHDIDTVSRHVVKPSFLEFANSYNYNVRYPLGHVSEHVHRDYAEMIYQEHL